MQDIRPSLINEMLLLVPFEGWSGYALQQAAQRAGADALALSRAFPGGVKDCVDYFICEENRKLEETIPQEELMRLRVPERIERLVFARLAAWLPKREAIRRLVSFNALPWNSAVALKHLYGTVDCMWRLAGDTATDYNFYTKRMTLAAVYGSTLLFWLNDTSSGQEETRTFLKRRLQDVAGFGQLKKKLRSFAA